MDDFCWVVALWDAEVGSLWWRRRHELGVGRVLARLHLSASVQKLKEDLFSDGMLDAVAHGCREKASSTSTSTAEQIFG